MPCRKVNAGSLFIVVIITLVMALMTSALLMYAWLMRSSDYDQVTRIRLLHNLESAFTKELFSPSKTSQSVQCYDLYADGQDTVCIGSFYWGMYDITSAKAYSQHDTVQRSCMKGSAWIPECQSAIYLLDRERALGISGTAIIKGTAYLPTSGIKKTYLEDNGYISDVLVNGQIKTSGRYLPEPDSLRLAFIQQWMHGTFSSSMRLLTTPLSDSINHSFQHPTDIYVLQSNDIGRQRISGNIILYSDHLIRVSREALLDNVILIAPAVIFSSGFKGRVQVFAADSILLEKQCSLHYPSVLMLMKQNYGTDMPHITLQEHVLVEGSVIAWQQKDDLLRSLIRIEQHAEVQGQVCSNGKVMVKGKVIGNTTAYSLYYKTSATEYDNLLLNATLDYTSLSNWFVPSFLMKTRKTEGRIVQWL